MFFLSGFCGLSYQTIWIRLAYAHFGITTHVLSVILSVFMLGLALGSWAGGIGAVPLSRWTGRTIFFFYAAVEVFTGLGGCVVPWLFSQGRQSLLSLGAADSASYLFFSGLVILVSLLPWCIAMGATFPLGMQFIREKNSTEKESFSFLYLANVLGACSGVLATAFILVEWLGFNGTLKTASSINFAVGTGSLIWAFLLPAPLRVDTPIGNSQALKQNAAHFWYPALLFSTGFISMAMEVAWVRDYTPILGNEVYAFSGLLAVYLFATWMGSWFYRSRMNFPKAVPVETLLVFLSSLAFLPVALNDPRWHHSPLVALLSLAPFCGALGYLTPCLIDRFSQGDAQAAGKGYAFNILGCILGPLLASYLLLPFLGARWTLIILALPFFFFMWS